MFGRKKPGTESAATMPPLPPKLEDDLPPMPTHLKTFQKPANGAANGQSLGDTAQKDTPKEASAAILAAPKPDSAAAGAAKPALFAAAPNNPNSTNPTQANTGASMSDSNPTPTYRPEIPKRPAMELAPKPAMPSAVAAAPAPLRHDAPEPKVLIIGREISLTGQITACDKVVVEGKVEATLTDTRFAEIAESGQFKGSAEVEEAEVRGKFEGKLSVRGRLLIRGSGKVMGEIAYGQIEVECGGEISGTVQTVSAGRVGTSAAA